ncbi:MAG: SMC-Scp complex subunit ScpB [Phycisphaeraceae bacterium]
MTTDSPPTPPASPPGVDAGLTAGTVETEVEAGELDARVEAVLMTSDRSVGMARLVDLTSGGSAEAVGASIERLNGAYETTGRVFRIQEVAGGWQVLTRPEVAEVVAQAQRSKSQGKLSPSALETLSVVAYRQPVMRAEVETIRGVGCGEVLRQLMERQLVKVVGRAEEVGRPMLYGTTKRFLEVFGLGSLRDLPQRETLVPKRPKKVKAKEETVAEGGDEVAEGDAS